MARTQNVEPPSIRHIRGLRSFAAASAELLQCRTMQNLFPDRTEPVHYHPMDQDNVINEVFARNSVNSALAVYMQERIVVSQQLYPLCEPYSTHSITASHHHITIASQPRQRPRVENTHSLYEPCESILNPHEAS